MIRVFVDIFNTQYSTIEVDEYAAKEWFCRLLPILFSDACELGTSEAPIGRDPINIRVQVQQMVRR